MGDRHPWALVGPPPHLGALGLGSEFAFLSRERGKEDGEICLCSKLQ